LNQDISSSH